VPDTEKTKSTGLLNRMIAEKNRPQADVFWSGDPVRAAILKSKGVSAPYQSASSKNLPKQYSDPDGYWFTGAVVGEFAAASRGLSCLLSFAQSTYNAALMFAIVLIICWSC
jgi:ABC-type Fe3+ transport system substrate-binding protein